MVYKKRFKSSTTTSTEELKTLTGSKLRSYAYALLAKREYSKADLTNKLLRFACDENEVLELIEQLIDMNYQSDERFAKQILRSQMTQGQGPARIKLKLKQKSVNVDFIQEELEENDWLIQAYQLKVRKFGTDIEHDQKKKAKQIRFLQYRGYSLDIIFKVIAAESEEVLYE